MTTPRRLLEAPQTAADEVVALAASVPARALEAGGWEHVTARALLRGPSGLRLLPAFAVSTLAGVLLVLAVRPLVRSTPDVVAAPETRWAKVSSDEVSLEAGRLTVRPQRGRGVRVKTPHVTIEASSSKFLAEVTRAGTTVLVEEGDVLVRAFGLERRVAAGASFTWPVPVEIPVALQVEAPAEATTCQGSPQLIRHCLEAEAQGASLSAEAAAYELGALEVRSGDLDAAERAWRDSLARFPDGVLAPEVTLSLALELVRAGRLDDATQGLRQFLARWPADPRGDDVMALLRSIEAVRRPE